MVAVTYPVAPPDVAEKGNAHLRSAQVRKKESGAAPAKPESARTVRHTLYSKTIQTEKGFHRKEKKTAKMRRKAGLQAARANLQTVQAGGAEAARRHGAPGRIVWAGRT